MFTNASFASFQNGEKFTIYQLIYVINELVSGKKFTNSRSLLSSGLLSPGSTVFSNFRPNLTTTSDMVPLREGRCFSMCEPDDLSHRDDKLMKPIGNIHLLLECNFILFLATNLKKSKLQGM